ncbi:MAG: SDR family NAD(P)-dependent oxidoreductase, partial [Gemmatimonadetes bacterium]|nr:SDR family NAD(P)-dependent oxidoreductase [Gemmatimonadota bacterium]
MMIPASSLDLFSLKGRTALVTGGSKGLGEAMACALSAAGADVALTSRNAEEARAAAAQIRAHTNGRVLAFQADAADRAQVEASVSQINDALGPIDILVNNAGINIRSPIVELRDEDWDAVIAINLTGPM